MEAPDVALVLAVEHARHGVVVVRVAGELGRNPPVRLARLLDRYLRPAGGPPLHLVVDLGDVRSFGDGGLQVIRRAASACTGSPTSFHVTGVAARLDALPVHVGASLAELSCFPTLEDALDSLPPRTRRRGGRAEELAGTAS